MERFTCLIKKDDKIIFSSTINGIKPLLEIKEKEIDVKGAVAYDKIVGKAASLIYVYLGVKEIHADVISESAISVLDRYKIKYDYKKIVDKIINRKGDDICPMEKTVLLVDDPEEAFIALNNKVTQMQKSLNL